MKTLNIISSAYRGTLEEQDDTIVWLTHAMRAAGADIDVLLRGAAVNYAVSGQEVAPLSFGERTQSHVPDVYREVERLIDNKATLFVLSDILQRRGLDEARLLKGVRPISATALAGLISGYDVVWNW
jgi:sulfur relay (sulfurtransferase) DsrF/TusC family protein